MRLKTYEAIVTKQIREDIDSILRKRGVHYNHIFKSRKVLKVFLPTYYEIIKYLWEKNWNLSGIAMYIGKDHTTIRYHLIKMGLIDANQKGQDDE